ncbi:MAG: recombinase RecJ, partial [Lachnospiraceae bacterium]|nr:recombinase RecJ [Lachnospiraceae bacterium]
KDSKTGDKISIIPHAKSCISTGKRSVYAKKLDHRVKLFTTWDEEKYYLAKPGDYLVSVVDNPSDVYIVAAGIFAITYEEVR